MRPYHSKSGFTLVEILIVVIILGILAAVVIPQFTSASQDARKNSLSSQLQTLRSQIELYKLQHRDQLPAGLDTAGTIAAATAWAEMLVNTNEDGAIGTTADHRFGPYMQQIPRNPLNGLSNVQVVAEDKAAGDAAGATVGFVLNRVNGKLWGTTKSGTKIYDEANPNNPVNDE